MTKVFLGNTDNCDSSGLTLNITNDQGEELCHLKKMEEFETNGKHWWNTTDALGTCADKTFSDKTISFEFKTESGGGFCPKNINIYIGNDFYHKNWSGSQKVANGTAELNEVKAEGNIFNLPLAKINKITAFKISSKAKSSTLHPLYYHAT